MKAIIAAMAALVMVGTVAAAEMAPMTEQQCKDAKMACKGDMVCEKDLTAKGCK